MLKINKRDVGGSDRGLSLPRVQKRDSAAKVEPTKSGCYTCRIRRKKCDERPNAEGHCETCVRLRLECLGFGTKRPDCLRELSQFLELRQKIKAFFASGSRGFLSLSKEGHHDTPCDDEGVLRSRRHDSLFLLRPFPDSAETSPEVNVGSFMSEIYDFTPRSIPDPVDNISHEFEPYGPLYVDNDVNYAVRSPVEFDDLVLVPLESDPTDKRHFYSSQSPSSSNSIIDSTNSTVLSPSNHGAEHDPRFPIEDQHVNSSLPYRGLPRQGCSFLPYGGPFGFGQGEITITSPDEPQQGFWDYYMSIPHPPSAEPSHFPPLVNHKHPCFFCRHRKIACSIPEPDNPDRTCNQCRRRSLKCEYPLENRRVMRRSKH